MIRPPADRPLRVLEWVRFPNGIWNLPRELAANIAADVADVAQVTVMSPATRREADDLLPDADVVLGFAVRAANFARARLLRWIHSTAASVTGVLFPELVTITSLATSSGKSTPVTLAAVEWIQRSRRARAKFAARTAKPSTTSTSGSSSSASAREAGQSMLTWATSATSATIFTARSRGRFQMPFGKRTHSSTRRGRSAGGRIMAGDGATAAASGPSATANSAPDRARTRSQAPTRALLSPRLPISLPRPHRDPFDSPRGTR